MTVSQTMTNEEAAAWLRERGWPLEQLPSAVRGGALIWWATVPTETGPRRICGETLPDLAWQVYCCTGLR